MAHPTFTLSEADRPNLSKIQPVVNELCRVGLVGMEVHYKDYTSKQIQTLADISYEAGLIPFGGTDYHASGNPGEPEPGYIGPPMETVHRLKALRDHAK